MKNKSNSREAYKIWNSNKLCSCETPRFDLKIDSPYALIPFYSNCICSFSTCRSADYRSEIMSSEPKSLPQITVESRRRRRRHGFLISDKRSSGEESLIDSPSPLNSPSTSSSNVSSQNLNYSPPNHKLNEIIKETELGSSGEEERLSFDFKFLRRFKELSKVLFTPLLSNSSYVFFFLISICLLEEYVIYQVGLVPSKYYKVLGDKDLNGFWRHTAMALGIIIAVAFVKSTRQYVSKILTVTWRECLTEHIHDLYFSSLHYYQLNVLDKLIDNPDQRITQDVDKFTTTYCEILPKILISPFIVAYYSYQAFSKAGWQGPTGCFLFFLIGSILNRFVMSPVVRLVAKQEKKEGDFRFVHMRVRLNAESIAFQNGSRSESLRAGDSLSGLLKVQSSLYFRQYFLNISINLYAYLGSILSYIILAIPIFGGSYDSLTPTELTQIISENSFVNMYLIYQFSQLVELSAKFSEVIGITHRITQLLERLLALSSFWKDLFPHDDHQDFNKKGKGETYEDFEKFRAKLDAANPNGNLAEFKNGTELMPAWILHEVSYAPPFSNELLVSNLNFTINVGESLLIVGPSSAGKSSLLRVLCGLWPPAHGKIERFHPPGPSGAFYSPQKPYLTLGTLREQICYPLKPSPDKEELEREKGVMLKFFKLVQMEHLLERVHTIDSPVSWDVYESLSPGEIQRLCILRVFYHRPLVALLDESTSALPPPMEQLIYEEFIKLGITTVSIAHRDSLRKFHTKVLELTGLNGSWTYT